MRFILTEERADFDTIAAMLASFLLHQDSVLLLPERLTPEVEAFFSIYYHKLPFVQEPKLLNASPRIRDVNFGLDYLQSLQMTNHLMARAALLDNFFASVLLIGILTSTQYEKSHSVHSRAQTAVDYLLEQGADEDLVRQWVEDPPRLKWKNDGLGTMHIDFTMEITDFLPGGLMQMAELVNETACEFNTRVYFVGGFVRDFHLQQSMRDLDLLLEGDAVRVAMALKKKFGGELILHREFGTARWNYGQAIPAIRRYLRSHEKAASAELGESLDLITARTEWYEHPAALPTVRFGSVELDLRRRDFTINAMAIPVGEFGTRVLADAESDLTKKIIRALHPLSFRDDPTRMYRAVRYERRLQGQIHLQTLSWLSDSLEYAALVAGERLRHELNWAFLEAEPHLLLQRMEELGLLNAIIPGLHWDIDLAEILQSVLYKASDSAWQLSANFGNLVCKQMLGYAVWFHLLDGELLRAVTKRFAFSIQQGTQFLLLQQVCSQAEPLNNAANSQWAQALDGLSNEMLLVLDCLWREQFPAAHEKIIAYRDHWKAMKPFHTGSDLQSLEIPPGPVYAALLRRLRDARIDGLTQTREQEWDLLLGWLQEQGIARHASG